MRALLIYAARRTRGVIKRDTSEDTMEDKIRFMRAALARAKKGLAQGEVPVGAVVVCEGKIVGSGYNRRTRTQMASSHAEMYAIDRACKKLKSWRLPDCDLYVTLEPCPMCMGAALNARIRKIYFGAYEQKGRSMTRELAASNLLNHTVEVEGGVLEEECSAILSGFFRAMRAKAKAAAAQEAPSPAQEGELGPSAGSEEGLSAGGAEGTGAG